MELWRREQYRMKPEWKIHFKCGHWKFNPNLWNSPEIKEVSVSLKGQCLPDSSGDGNKQLAAASLLLLSCARRCWRPEHLFFFSLKPDIFEFEPIISHLQRSVQRWNTAFKGENFLLLPESTCGEQRAGNKVRYRGDVITLPVSTEITPLPQERAAQRQTHTKHTQPAECAAWSWIWPVFFIFQPLFHYRLSSGASITHSSVEKPPPPINNVWKSIIHNSWSPRTHVGRGKRRAADMNIFRVCPWGWLIFSLFSAK